ncbi:MAG: AEC family transporter [Spiroplasma sp.]|nr:AEC family transporter [Spiroplasma sp.]
MILASESISDAVLGTLKNWGFWSAIGAAIFVIFLGFLLTWKNILKKEWDKVLIKLVMTIGLPSLALQGFLTDITIDELKNQMAVLAIGFIFYALMAFGTRLFFLKYDRDVQDTLAMCIAFASTTFFGLPIVSELFKPTGAAIGNMFNVPYRVFLYSLAFIIMTRKNPKVKLSFSEKKALKIKETPNKKQDPQAYQSYVTKKKTMQAQQLKNIFLNPILIATFVGVIIWATQLIPGIQVVTIPGINQDKAFSPLRIDLLFPPIANILKILAGICTPLAWIAIGMQLSDGNFKQAMRSKTVWYATFLKIIVAPVIILAIAIAIAWIGSATGAWKLSKAALGVLVIMTATPPASVVVSYSIAFNKEPKIASDLTLITTLMAIITLPLWVIVVTAIGTFSIFG